MSQLTERLARMAPITDIERMRLNNTCPLSLVWDKSDHARLVMARRAVLAGYYNDGGPITPVCFDMDYLRTGR